MFPSNKFRSIDHYRSTKELENEDETLQAIKEIIVDYKMKFGDDWKNVFQRMAPIPIINHPYSQMMLKRKKP